MWLLAGILLLAGLAGAFYVAGGQRRLVDQVTRSDNSYLFTDYLQAKDPLALTAAGQVRSYRIDRQSIASEGNRIFVSYYVNNNPKASLGLELKNDQGLLEVTEIKPSKAFTRLVTNQDYQALTGQIKQAVNQVKTEGGWDADSSAGYYERLRELMKKRQRKDLSQTLTDLASEAKQVGSPVYTNLFVWSNLSAKDKLALVMTQMKAEVDSHNFLQMGTDGYRFSSDLAPNGDFFTYFRKAVMDAYPTSKGLNADHLGLKVHLFRSYIDKQAIDYVRSHFKGKTDYEKLLAFAKKNKLTFDYTTGAVLHNRTQGDFTYTQHMKVQLPKSNTSGDYGTNNARFIEYIVDLKTGRFVSEWNVYRQLADGSYDSDPDHYAVADGADAANTESANYGLPKGLNNDVPAYLTRSHRYLDVTHPPDTVIRRKMTKVWRPAKLLSKGGRYADIVKKGGQSDYDEWNAVQDDQKEGRYGSFIASPYVGDGFRDFSNKQSKK
ncbi:hypothetical protein STRDD12_01281 [Streptococcus sp. DD12]|nr:hypothetical protein STRDD12_01281 [Streptococcus sp. DD12]